MAEGPGVEPLAPFTTLSVVPWHMQHEPTDEDLILYYLRPKLFGINLPILTQIYNANIYEHTPESLTEPYDPQGKGYWYFFTSLSRNGNVVNRIANGGSWVPAAHVSYSSKMIVLGNQEIGSRNLLEFYKGNGLNSQPTEWRMEEYRVKDGGQFQENKVEVALCRIFKKVDDDTSTSL